MSVALNLLFIAASCLFQGYHGASSSIATKITSRPREKVSFDFGWRHKLNNNPNGIQCPDAEIGVIYGIGGRKFEKVSTPDMCCSYCATSSTCQCWDWNNETLLCYLKSNCNSKKSDKNRISGIFKKSTSIPPEAKMDYDDSSWELVDAPHDMLIAQPYDPSASQQMAYIQRNVGWYRKHLL